RTAARQGSTTRKNLRFGSQDERSSRSFPAGGLQKNTRRGRHSVFAGCHFRHNGPKIPPGLSPCLVLNGYSNGFCPPPPNLNLLLRRSKPKRTGLRVRPAFSVP